MTTTYKVTRVPSRHGYDWGIVTRVAGREELRETLYQSEIAAADEARRLAAMEADRSDRQAKRRNQWAESG